MIYGIIGGDMRNRYLAKVLNRKNKEVIVYNDYGIHSIDKNINVTSDISEFVEKSDIIISGIPLTKDKENISSKFLEEKVNLNEFLNLLKNKTFVSGVIPDECYKILEENHNKVLDIMDLDSFAIYNAIATAEGTIASMINESPINVSGSNVMVLGFGRCSKILCDKLKGIGANVTVVVRKTSDIAYIKAYGYKALTYKELESNVKDFSFIINTVPSLVITKDIIKKMDKDTLIIDIASLPGGVDFNEAKENNIKTLHLLGIPGLIAPESSAEIIYNVIEEIK